MYGSILEINGGDGLDGKSDRGNGEEWTDLRDVLGAERMEWEGWRAKNLLWRNSQTCNLQRNMMWE